ncbi:hypothetical protein [Arthrobacter sp. Soil763]|uniref:hypothetical protein n=1 Tax=Arthrobacter sp. Soil763 TaxID=1736402 RepID=UPI00070100FF|nr:hypothetical protein [Arthrobacter sp. Soil763]KRE80086.1 hypothetical protein ASG71_08665 [Arthrobacter sp. Soil763]
MTGTVLPRGLRFTAALALTAAALAGCSGDGNGTPVWTAGTPAASPTSDAAGGSTAGTGAAASGTPSATAGTAAPGATASAWKTYSDPGKTVSFDLPQDWIAQSVAPAAGTLPGALRVEVKDAEGRYLATLQTGLRPQPAGACKTAAAKPYVVVSSVPVELPHRGGEGTIEPHVVYRVIQGYKYFGSYGITNVVGGAAGKACALRNIVRGTEAAGDYSFGDLVELKAFAPDQKVAPAKAFDTLDQADKYVNQGSEFANVQRMLMSLKIKN